MKLSAPSLWRHPALLLLALFGVHVRRFTVDIGDQWRLLPPSLYNFSVRCDGRDGIVQCDADTIVFSPPGAERTVLVGHDCVTLSMRAEVLGFGATALDALRRLALARADGAEAAPAPGTALIGEYSFSARDNGVALFEAIRAGGPDSTPSLRALYVIEADAEDRAALDDRGDLLDFGSFAHIRACLEAGVVAYSHDLRNVFPDIVAHLSPAHAAAVPTLFLQHGVTALKRSVRRVYHRARTNASAVNVCSRWEAGVFKRHFGFDASRIVVAGFARHDRLWQAYRMSKPPDARRILVLPTWRRDLNGADAATLHDSTFVQQWSAAIGALRRRGLHVTLMLHPIIAHLEPLFEDVADAIVPISMFQRALLASSAFVTDYSSTCFEAIYVERPVFFFMFDAERYGFRPFLDVETELPGPLCRTSADLADAVERSFASGWQVDAAFHRTLFFDHMDAGNSARLRDALLALARSYSTSSQSSG